MKLIRGNKALAEELCLTSQTISNWLVNGKIRCHKRVGNVIFYDLDNLFVESKRFSNRVKN